LEYGRANKSEPSFYFPFIFLFREIISFKIYPL
jgi:hypothetical protein